MTKKTDVLRYYLRFRYRKFRDRRQLEAYQRKKIRRQLEFVTGNSEFYKKYRDRRLTELPVIDKSIMMENFDRINTVGIKKEEALEFAVDSERKREFSAELDNITVGLSSGTSDSRGVFLVEDSEKAKWAGYVLAHFLPRGITAHYNIAFFMRANSNLYESVGSKNIRFEFLDIYSDMNENLRRLEEMDADIIVGQPSVLLMVADAAENGEINVSPESVVSIAEVLEKEDEERLREAFGLSVIHQVYQCTEGCLASTCRCGTLHLNEDIVYIEKQYLDDKRFIPIVTDFERTSQPIIRYRLNDVLVEDRRKCPCGSVFTALEKIEGREDDIFIFDGKSGGTVSVFPDFIRRCVLFAGNIRNYRVVQSEDGSIIIFSDADDAGKERLRQEFEKLSADKDFTLPEISFCEFEYQAGKKLRRVESRRKN